MRALDQARPPAERIVDDPYAPWFLGKLARAQLAAGPLAGAFLGALTGYIQARHRFMDDALRRALTDRSVDQVVVLGAGYDMRAWRFSDLLAGRPVFEVDYPSTQRRKLRLLRGRPAPPVDVRRVEIDFQRQTLAGVLEPVGFRPGARTFFTWEGVSMYLTRAAVKSTLGALHALGGPGSVLTVDFWQLLDSPDLIATAHRVSAGFLHLLGEPITFGIHPEDGEAFLGRLGWEVNDLADAAELARRYAADGRPIYPANFVVRAVRR